MKEALLDKIQKKQAVISVDLSGQSLHQRGYRQFHVPAPLKENLAAALLYKAHWPEVCDKGGDFVDNYTYQHMHLAQDFQVPGLIGCTPCGVAAPGGDLFQLQVKRNHRE